MTSSPARPGETESESLDTGPVGHRLQGAVTAANVADTTMFAAVLEDVPPIRTPSGRRRTRPAAVHTDKGYDSAANRGMAAAAWDHPEDRPAWHRVFPAAGPPPVCGGAGAVVAELLAAVGSAVGSGSGRWFAFVLAAAPLTRRSSAGPPTASGHI
jgi:hypothetical protein